VTRGGVFYLEGKSNISSMTKCSFYDCSATEYGGVLYSVTSNYLVCFSENDNALLMLKISISCKSDN
jgi:hypothetical protein